MNDEQMTFDEAPRERHLRVAGKSTTRAHQPPRELDFGLEPGTAVSKESINAAFKRFHAANPQVLDKLIELAEVAQRSGRRTGIKMLWEVMRWDLTIRTDSLEDFKLNNNYTSRYVRLIQHQRPDLAEMFRTRTLRAP